MVIRFTVPLRRVLRAPSSRTFSSTRIHTATAAAAQPPSRPAVLVISPSPKVIEEQDLNVDPIPPHEAKIQITERAADQLRQISARENDPDAALRIAVESGGCHGYQYKMELVSRRQVDDYHFSHPTLKPSNILVDTISMGLLNGSTVDFATELIGSSFRILTNPQAKGSGCGCGVSWELKL